jgi:hypothetical protein
MLRLASICLTALSIVGCGPGEDHSKVLPVTGEPAKSTQGATSPRDVSTTKNIPMH